MRGIGGSERHLLTLLPALGRAGLDPAFVGLDDPAWHPDPFYAELETAGVPFVRLPVPRYIDPRLVTRLRQALRRLRPDLVHTHLVHADVFGTLASPCPVVSTKHNDDRFRVGPFRRVERLLARRVARVIAITHALAQFTVERVGLPADKVDVVHYGLDAVPKAWADNSAIELPANARVLLAVSRLERQKGLDVAVEALSQVRRNHPDAVLVVLGEGPERARLAGEGLFLPGRVGDVAAWLERAEVLVHPARWEGFGLALLEAMLSGLPVVATRVSAIPEIVVDGETGLLVPPDDAGALAEAIDRVLADPEQAGRLGAAGLVRARSEFSVERMASGTVAVYERALGRAPSPSPSIDR
jgi:glycosyltransferase involved in cell wall biosynthesis